jgi:hypothetical protein
MASYRGRLKQLSTTVFYGRFYLNKNIYHNKGRLEQEDHMRAQAEQPIFSSKCNPPPTKLQIAAIFLLLALATVTMLIDH